jgi:myosin heavy subunit
VKNKNELNEAAALLNVPAAELEKVFVTRILQVKDQAPITVGLSSNEAKAARDAVSKFMYDKLFDWLVERINQSIGKGAAIKGQSIGILDIFGFEIFQRNSFEQVTHTHTAPPRLATPSAPIRRHDSFSAPRRAACRGVLASA